MIKIHFQVAVIGSGFGGSLTAMCRHPVFTDKFRRLCESARQPAATGETVRLQQQIREAIEPFDVAGLTDRSRHPWFPALSADLLRSAPKLGASEPKIMTMLRKCGLVED
jgi:hypothetical protein